MGGLINADLELDLLSCLMNDNSLAGKLVTAYRGVAADPSRLWGVPAHREIARVLFENVTPERGKISPSVLATKIPSDGPDALTISNRWSLGLNNQWREIATALRALAMQREIVEEMRKHKWSEPLPNILDASEQLARKISDARSALLPYDPSAPARAQELLELRASDKLGRLVTTGIREWDDNLFAGIRLDPGEATVIHGRPKVFKTTLVCNLVLGLLRKGIAVTHITAERGYTVHDLTAQYLRILTAHHFRLNYPKAGLPPFDHDRILFARSFSAEEEHAFGVAINEWNLFPIYLYARPPDQGGTGDPATALGWARLDRELRDVKLVVVDNFQSWREPGQNDYDLMNATVPPVTALQSDYGLALIAISQESTEGGVRGSPIDLPAMVNNEVQMTIDESSSGEYVTAHLKLILSRFRASGRTGSIRIHAKTGLIV